MLIRIKPYCKKSKLNKSSRESPIYLAVSMPGEREILLSTGLTINANNFDNKSGSCIGRTGKSGQIQSRIIAKVQNVEQIIDEIERIGELPSLSEIKERYQHKGSSDSFLVFARHRLVEEKAALSKSTYGNYIHCLNNLESYAPGITFSRITKNFLNDYRNYLLYSKGRNEKGVYQDLATIRKFWNVAKENGKVQHYPFEKLKIKNPKKKKIKYLVISEFQKLYSLYSQNELNARHANALYHYLLGCLTGLRSKDLRELSLSNHHDKSVFENILSTGFVSVKTSKSRYKKTVDIPLNSMLRELVAHPYPRPLVLGADRRNKALREILEIAGIGKHLSFHSSRHTFGVVSKQLGIDTAVIQDILGHESISTTELYAQIAKDLKVNDMAKWDNI